MRDWGCAMRNGLAQSWHSPGPVVNANIVLITLMRDESRRVNASDLAIPRSGSEKQVISASVSYTAPVSDEGRPGQKRPAEFKTTLDDTGGLVRLLLVGGLHEGRELYIDEREIPPEIWTNHDPDRFSWWPERVRDAMTATPTGGDPANPPGHYALEVDEETREARYVARD